MSGGIINEMDFVFSVKLRFYGAVLSHQLAGNPVLRRTGRTARVPEAVADLGRFLRRIILRKGTCPQDIQI